MKSEMSLVDLHFMVKELQFLIGAKINQIFQHSQKDFTFELHVTGKGRQLLKVNLPSFLYLASRKDKTLPTPPGFCMFLRKRLKNARIRKIEQLGSERLVHIEIETKDDQYNVILELFSKGNLIVCDKDYNIISLVESQRWKNRTVRPGIQYEIPSREFDFFNPDEKSVKSLLSDGQDALVRRIARQLGVGGVIAEEICLRTGISKEDTTFNVKKAKKILKAIKEIASSKPDPQIVYKEGKVKDIVPIRLEFYEGHENKPYGNFSEALDTILFQEAQVGAEAKVKSVYDKQIAKQQEIIDKQQKQIKSLEKSAEESKKKADLLYEKYQLADSIIKEIRTAAKKHSWLEIKKRLKGHKVVKEVNTKEKTVVIDI